MSFNFDLTEFVKSRLMTKNPSKKEKPPKNDFSKLELEDNYYENLFLEEMEFKNDPKKEKIQKLLKKYCKSVEYFSSIEEEKKSKEYKVLIDLFLNDQTVINLLEDKENNNNNSNINIKNILISNKIKKIENRPDDSCKNWDLEKLKKMFDADEHKVYNELMKKNDKRNDNGGTINIINEEIKNQRKSFHENLKIKRNSKVKKEKTINENKIIQSIQNAFINEKEEDKREESINNLNDDEEQITEISPIKFDEKNLSEENPSSGEIKSFNSQKNNLTNKKENTSEFEPLTPLSKFEKSENSKSSNNKEFNSSNIKEVNETNDFSLNNESNGITDDPNEKENKNITLIKNNNICSNETKDSFSNNSSLASKNLAYLIYIFF